MYCRYIQLVSNTCSEGNLNYIRVFRDSWNYSIILLDSVCRSGVLCNCGYKVGRCKTPAIAGCVTSLQETWLLLIWGKHYKILKLIDCLHRSADLVSAVI